MIQGVTSPIRTTHTTCGYLNIMATCSLRAGAIPSNSSPTSSTIPRSWYLHQPRDGHQTHERGKAVEGTQVAEKAAEKVLDNPPEEVVVHPVEKVLDNPAENPVKVLDNPIKSPPLEDALKPGELAWVKVPGRSGKIVTVRALIDACSEEKVTVELYPEFQLPVRFMVTLERGSVEPV